MPPKQKKAKKQQKEQIIIRTAEEVVPIIIENIFKDKFNQNTIDYISGVLESLDDLEQSIQNEEMVTEQLKEALEDKPINEKQIKEYTLKIIQAFCIEMNIKNNLISNGEQEQENENENLAEEEKEEESKKEQENINKYKARFKDLLENVDENMIWDEKTIQEFEQMKIEQEKQMKYGCVLCERIIPLTFHHLIPRTTHSRPYNKGKSVSELNTGIWICRQCHSGIHRLIDEETMAQSFYNYDLLIEHEGVIKMAKYMNKQKISCKQDRRVLYGDQYLTKNKSERL